MYCRKCGEMLSDHEKSCHVCGEPVEETAGLNSVHMHQQYCAHGTGMPSPSIGMGEVQAVFQAVCRFQRPLQTQRILVGNAGHQSD